MSEPRNPFVEAGTGGSGQGSALPGQRAHGGGRSLCRMDTPVHRADPRM